MERIVEITGGYTYLIQEMCNTVWSRVEDKKIIDLEMVEDSVPEFFTILDRGFFSVRAMTVALTARRRL